MTITKHHPFGFILHDKTRNTRTPYPTATTAIIDPARGITTVLNRTATVAIIPTANIAVIRCK